MNQLYIIYVDCSVPTLAKPAHNLHNKYRARISKLCMYNNMVLRTIVNHCIWSAYRVRSCSRTYAVIVLRHHVGERA